MNIENMLKVKQRVKDSPNFAMESFFDIEEEFMELNKSYLASAIKARTTNPCGTAACIAGEAVLLLVEETTDKNEANLYKGYDIAGEAAKYLDLTHTQAEWLFYGEWRDDLEDVTKEEALLAMEYLIAGGDVKVTDQFGFVEWAKFYSSTGKFK